MSGEQRARPGPGHHVIREPAMVPAPPPAPPIAGDQVTIDRREFDILLAVATLYLNSFTEGEAMAFTEAFAYTNVQEIVEKHGRRY